MLKHAHDDGDFDIDHDARADNWKCTIEPKLILPSLRFVCVVRDSWSVVVVIIIVVVIVVVVVAESSQATLQMLQQ